MPPAGYDGPPRRPTGWDDARPLRVIVADGVGFSPKLSFLTERNVSIRVKHEYSSKSGPGASRLALPAWRLLTH